MDSTIILRDSETYRRFWNIVKKKLGHGPSGFEMDEVLKDFNASLFLYKGPPDYNLGIKFQDENDVLRFKIIYDFETEQVT
jgi:hypothetical protein